MMIQLSCDFWVRCGVLDCNMLRGVSKCPFVSFINVNGVSNNTRKKTSEYNAIQFNITTNWSQVKSVPPTVFKKKLYPLRYRIDSRLLFWNVLNLTCVPNELVVYSKSVYFLEEINIWPLQLIDHWGPGSYFLQEYLTGLFRPAFPRYVTLKCRIDYGAVVVNSGYIIQRRSLTLTITLTPK